MNHREEICTSILNIIRDSSAAGHLVQGQDILSELKGQGLLESVDLGEGTHPETLFRQVLQANQDVNEILGRKGVPYYYSAAGMSETYAGILLWKAESPLWLIAEVVRENSRLYPSPVPLGRFREPPFDLPQETIEECLAALGQDRQYQDIEQTRTSIGTTFLYSSRHLDPDYAAMLAEWIDVGQGDNP